MCPPGNIQDPHSTKHYDLKARAADPEKNTLSYDFGYYKDLDLLSHSTKLYDF